MLDRKVVWAIAVALIALTSAYLFSSWNAVIEVNKPCIEVQYTAPSLNASGAPYETFVISENGLEESEIMPSAYKIFKIKLNSDKVKAFLNMEIEGAYNYTIVYYITKIDLNPVSLTQWHESVKIVPKNNTATIILDKAMSIEYYIWIDGKIRTSNETRAQIIVQLYAEPIP